MWLALQNAPHRVTVSPCRPIKYWACASNNASLCYAATTGGLDRTIDKGLTWAPVPGAVLAGDCRGTFLDKASRPPTVWHATASGIFKWADGQPGGVTTVRVAVGLWLSTVLAWWRWLVDCAAAVVAAASLAGPCRTCVHSSCWRCSTSKCIGYFLARPAGSKRELSLC
jgi:hypothetical protein